METDTLCIACEKAPLVWCAACHTPQELASGFCTKCLQAARTECQYCWRSATLHECAWRACSEDGCSRVVFACSQCERKFQTSGTLCKLCWGRRGRQCISCGKTPAQTLKACMHMCKMCMSGVCGLEIIRFGSNVVFAVRSDRLRHSRRATATGRMFMVCVRFDLGCCFHGVDPLCVRVHVHCLIVYVYACLCMLLRVRKLCVARGEHAFAHVPRLRSTLRCIMSS